MPKRVGEENKALKFSQEEKTLEENEDEEDNEDEDTHNDDEIVRTKVRVMTTMTSEVMRKTKMMRVGVINLGMKDLRTTQNGRGKR